jgi:hypothetical protein
MSAVPHYCDAPSETNFRDATTWHIQRAGCASETSQRLFRDCVEFCSGLVDLVVCVGCHVGSGHRCALVGERVVDLFAEDVTQAGDHGVKYPRFLFLSEQNLGYFTSSCARSAARIAAASASHRRVDPSMSVNRKVTTPEGRSPVDTRTGCHKLPTSRGQLRRTFETLVCRLFRDASCGRRPDRRHGIASAHFMCPSKPSVFALSR